MRPHATHPPIASNKTEKTTTDILPLLPHRDLISLQSGSLSETKRETIFEKPSYSGRSIPVSSIGWLWSNGAPTISDQDTHFRHFSTIHGGKSKVYLGESLPLTGIYRIIGVSKLIPKIDRTRKSGLFACRSYRLVGLYNV